MGERGILVGPLSSSTTDIHEILTIPIPETRGILSSAIGRVT